MFVRLVGVPVPALTLSSLDLAWWLGHGLEVAGVLLVASPRELATGGRLHDIGKLFVPDGVLKKPGALGDGEYALAVWG